MSNSKINSLLRKAEQTSNSFNTVIQSIPGNGSPGFYNLTPKSKANSADAKLNYINSVLSKVQGRVKHIGTLIENKELVPDKEGFILDTPAEKKALDIYKTARNRYIKNTKRKRNINSKMLKKNAMGRNHLSQFAKYDSTKDAQLNAKRQILSNDPIFKDATILEKFIVAPDVYKPFASSTMLMKYLTPHESPEVQEKEYRIFLEVFGFTKDEIDKVFAEMKNIQAIEKFIEAYKGKEISFAKPKIDPATGQQMRHYETKKLLLEKDLEKIAIVENFLKQEGIGEQEIPKLINDFLPRDLSSQMEDLEKKKIAAYDAKKKMVETQLQTLVKQILPLQQFLSNPEKKQQLDDILATLKPSEFTKGVNAGLTALQVPKEIVPFLKQPLQMFLSEKSNFLDKIKAAASPLDVKIAEKQLKEYDDSKFKSFFDAYVKEKLDTINRYTPDVIKQIAERDAWDALKTVQPEKFPPRRTLLEELKPLYLKFLDIYPTLPKREIVDYTKPAVDEVRAPINSFKSLPLNTQNPVRRGPPSFLAGIKAKAKTNSNSNSNSNSSPVKKSPPAFLAGIQARGKQTQEPTQEDPSSLASSRPTTPESSNTNTPPNPRAALMAALAKRKPPTATGGRLSASRTLRRKANTKKHKTRRTKK